MTIKAYSITLLLISLVGVTTIVAITYSQISRIEKKQSNINLLISEVQNIEYEKQKRLTEILSKKELQYIRENFEKNTTVNSIKMPYYLVPKKVNNRGNIYLCYDESKFNSDSIEVFAKFLNSSLDAQLPKQLKINTIVPLKNISQLKDYEKKISEKNTKAIILSLSREKNLIGFDLIRLETDTGLNTDVPEEIIDTNLTDNDIFFYNNFLLSFYNQLMISDNIKKLSLYSEYKNYVPK